ncbi:hypothetical protein [Flagellimonas sp.]|uniref:hypothetical protein n=1 Tax=Flagellimonas sp. TaxID=2058762 RepID=UPI003B52FC8C
MDAKKTTQQEIDKILESADGIEAVNSPPFFKDKVLRKLVDLEEVKPQLDVLAWFVPKYQIAVLLLFAALNFAVLYLYNSANKQDELQTFAESYNLSGSVNTSFLN